MTRSVNADLTLYYWYKGEKVALTLNNEYVNVLVDKNMRALQANSIFQNYLVQDDSILNSNLVKLKLTAKSAVSDYSQLSVNSS